VSGAGETPEPEYRVVATTFFGEKEVARYSTLEQAEHRAAELNEHAERNPRGYVRYSMRKDASLTPRRRWWRRP
jgi:hypothetical protein